MKHTAMTEEQIAESGLLPDGVYDFTIVQVTEGMSKSGNDMFTLKLHVFNTEGEPIVLLDWVLAAFPKKFKHLHDALGLLDLYAKGDTRPEDLEGKSGKLLLGKGKPYTDANGIERINNSVVDYVKRDNAETYKNASVRAAADLNDDIPFIWLLPLAFAAMSLLQTQIIA